MAALVDRLNDLAVRALHSIVGEDCEPMLSPTRDEKRGDYQCNAALSLAKKVKRQPRDLANELMSKMQALDSEHLIEKMEIAGPGFINITLSNHALQDSLELGHEPRCASLGKVVVDYSCPNIAKQMHVGHLRSTIIGDAICRILTYLGYEVIRQNHVGDWGTQFGLLCAWLMDRQDAPNYLEADLSDLESLYRASQALAGEDEDFHQKAKQRVVALHHGDEATLAVWRHIVSKSLEHINGNYQLMNVLLQPEDTRGESFYNPGLAAVVEELAERFPAGSRPMEVVENEGAVCVFLYDEQGNSRYNNAEEQKLPLIIRKSDGAFLYPTTDLAAIRYRCDELKAHRLIYVTDARQVLHFKMLFETAECAGWLASGQAEHVTFGSVLGDDNKPLKTRSGENVKLRELLDEAVARAEASVTSNAGGQEFSEAERHKIAEAVGIGAVKYADLSQNRNSDYVFSFERMLAMEGNTAPYLLYAYARISSILRRAQQEVTPGPISFECPEERRLVLHLGRFAETVAGAASGWRINLVCEYLYLLAGLYMKFYENCSVLSAENDELKQSRLRLCAKVGQVLKQGLDLLGLRVVERM